MIVASSCNLGKAESLVKLAEALAAFVRQVQRWNCCQLACLFLQYFGLSLY